MIEWEGRAIKLMLVQMQCPKPSLLIKNKPERKHLIKKKRGDNEAIVLKHDLFRMRTDPYDLLPTAN